MTRPGVDQGGSGAGGRVPARFLLGEKELGFSNGMTLGRLTPLVLSLSEAKLALGQLRPSIRRDALRQALG
jgi:hypothetical protein